MSGQIKRLLFVSVICLMISASQALAQSSLASRTSSMRVVISDPFTPRPPAKTTAKKGPDLKAPAKAALLSLPPVTIYYPSKGRNVASLPATQRQATGDLKPITIYYRVPAPRVSVAGESIQPKAGRKEMTAIASGSDGPAEGRPTRPPAIPEPPIPEERPVTPPAVESKDAVQVEPAVETAEPMAIEVKADIAPTRVQGASAVAPATEEPVAKTVEAAAPVAKAASEEVAAPVADAPPPNTIVAALPNPVPNSEEPITASESAEQVDPTASVSDEVVGLNNSAIELSKEQRYEEASLLLRKAVDAAPASFGLHRNLSIVYESMKRLDEALVEAKAAVNLAPRDPSALSQLCGLQLLTGRPADSVDCFGRLVEVSKLDALAETYYGVALLRAGFTDKAITVLTQAAATTPTSSSALNALGVAYFKQKRMSDALSAFKKAVEADPEQPQLRFNLAVVQMATKNKEGALSQYRMLKTEDPDLAAKLYRILFQDKLLYVGDLNQ